MASRLETIKIEKILKVTEFDLLRTKVQKGYMYMCLDSRKLYFDQGNSSADRVIYDYITVRTTNDLQYNITPLYGNVYYCWEDNSLWLWQNKWISLYQDSTYPSAYVYDDVPSVTSPASLNPIYRYDMPNSPADDNGLLKDGSVVIRDRQRIIKGRISIDEGNDNLIISSYLGGGIRFLPNGKQLSQGELLIGDDGETTLRSQFKVLNNELYVDYSEEPEKDHNAYPNNEHLYRVFHEGNLDTSAIQIMTPLQVYNKLRDTSTLPSVFEFNVRQLEGYTSEDFAKTEHTHNASQVTDLPDVVDSKCKVAIRKVFNSMSSQGITSSYNSVTDHLTLSVNDFTLTLSGGVYGSMRIRNLEDTDINVTVDPDKHTHQDIWDAIHRLEALINR